jgi:hypothetical protein
MKLSTHGLNPTLRFVIMNVLKLILLMGVSTQNCITMELVKFLEKKSKTSHSKFQIRTITLMMTSCRTMSKTKSENPIFQGQKQTSLLAFFLFSPWAILVIHPLENVNEYFIRDNSMFSIVIADLQRILVLPFYK